MDQAFLYAFGSYADSYAPIKIERLRGTTLVDVTRDAELHHRVLQDLPTRPSRRQERRGRCAVVPRLPGWAAESLLAGRGERAWTTMLTTHNREASTFEAETCSIDEPIAKCPSDKKGVRPFPDGLRLFLTEHGCIADPNLFAVPGDARPAQPTRLLQR